MGGFAAGEHRVAVRIYPDMIGGGGHVHNGRVMEMLERARFDLFRLLEARDPAMPRAPYVRYVVAAIEQRFLRPIMPEDAVVAATRIGHVGRSSCRLDHRLLREGDEELASARISLVFTDASGASTEQPRDWIEAFARAVGPQPAAP
ncbi:MAG: acyl-CoA thioesterase [Caulobacteraceae bacterium]|nr:acyl-CoA thioesterase [Caulobacter sp.]